jgi:phosphatidate cytidylyltransferase
MLKQRVITAVVLLAVLLPALFAKPLWPFAWLSLAAASAGAWEWARLNGLRGAVAVFLGLVVLAGGALAWWFGWALQAPQWPWWVAMLVWVLGGAFVLSKGVAGWPRLPAALRLVLGVLLLWLAWLALVQAKALGVNFLLSVFCLVWAADIAAYFGGRAFGRRKLAPAISPGKSWEGVWSGMLGVVVLAMLWLALDRRDLVDSASLYTRVSQQIGWLGMGVAVLFLAAMSVVGDLFESLVKRSAGAKDSSNLLPGHGGVLDRIDALLPVLPLAMALVSL